MEAHGVGTDASMATHVSNVIRRGFATLDEASRRLTPAPMGLALVHAMMLIDEGLVLPCVRANIERECARIARGEATFEHVVEHTIAMFRRRFVHFGRHAHRLPSMLAVALAADPFAASGGEHAELGNPGGLAAAAAWRDAARRTAAVDLDGLRDVASARVQAALRGPPDHEGGSTLRDRRAWGACRGCQMSPIKRPKRSRRLRRRKRLPLQPRQPLRSPRPPRSCSAWGMSSRSPRWAARAEEEGEEGEEGRRGRRGGGEEGGEGEGEGEGRGRGRGRECRQRRLGERRRWRRSGWTGRRREEEARRKGQEEESEQGRRRFDDRRSSRLRGKRVWGKQRERGERKRSRIRPPGL